MPNGGVPINLEMWQSPLCEDSVMLHQHGGTLRVLRIDNVVGLAHTVIGEIDVSQSFLRNVVNDILGDELEPDSLASRDGGVSVFVRPGILEVTSSKSGTLVTLSGDVRRILAGFMAYWVDHDGVVVPRSLPIDYGTRAADVNGVEWSLNWAM
jgi:hypothetical protein